MSSRPAIVLACVLHLFRPLARLLLRHGVAYPAFVQALKQVFMEAAYDELERAGKKQTDSAVSLLSGVHRRDVRTLGRMEAAPSVSKTPMNKASLVMSRWLMDPDYVDADGLPRPVPRSGDAPSFDALVSNISSDVRPRAVLDELHRLGLVEEEEGQVRLLDFVFAPKEGFEESAALLRDNLHDHAAAASMNLEDQRNFLEQAIYVDDLTEESVHRLHVVSSRAWRQAFKAVMAEARHLYDRDKMSASEEQKRFRARFGSYFFSSEDEEKIN